VAGTDISGLATALRSHLDRHGFAMVAVEPGPVMGASRTDPDDPWVKFALDSLERSTGARPALLPNVGGTLPNDAFTGELGLPTIWIPHSYPACAQHAPDEHLLAPLAREALQLMAACSGTSANTSSPRLLLETGADGRDALGVEAEPVHPADVARVLDLEAAVHDHRHAARPRRSVRLLR